MKKIVSYVLLLFVLLAGCNSDLYTKKLATESLDGKPSLSVISGYLDLKYTENKAAGFSLFRQVRSDVRKPLLIGLQTTATIALCVLIGLFKNRSFFTLLPYVMILSGALGNLIDRLRSGYVVDFIHLHIRHQFSWPIFNVADILIAVGISLVLLQVFLLKQRRIPARTD